MKNKIKTLLVCILTFVVCGSLVVGCGAKAEKKSSKEQAKAKLESMKERDAEYEAKEASKEAERESLYAAEEESRALEKLEEESIAREIENEKNGISTSNSNITGEDLKAAIVYINNNRVDLTSWADKDITEIIDELDNLGVTFNRINGTIRSDKQDLEIDKEVIKEAFNDIDVNSDRSLRISMGESEFDTSISLRYLPYSNTLEFSVDMEEDAEYGNELFQLTDEKYNTEKLNGIKLENLMGDNKLFESEGVLGLEKDKGRFRTILNKDYGYTFNIKDFKIDIKESADKKEVLTADVEKIKNRLGVLEYNNNKLDINELVAIEDITQVIDKLQEFGMTGAGYEFKSLYMDKNIPNERLNLDNTEELKEKANTLMDSYKENSESEVFKQGSLDVTVYLEPTNEQKTGKISLVYTVKFQSGQIAMRGVHIMNNDSKGVIKWTSDKIQIANGHDAEATRKMIEGLNNREKKIYSLEDSNYTIEVWLDEFDDSELETVIIQKKLEK